MRAWPVDPCNPGEVLACAGLAHLGARADAGALSGFVRARDGTVRFVGPDARHVLPAAVALERIAGPPHERLRVAGVVLDWWCPWGLNPAVKLWSGRQSAWTVHRTLVDALGCWGASDWRALTAPVSGGRLGLDPESAWRALALGWSFDLQATYHRALRLRCRPLVELLASIGLAAFPLAGHRRRGGLRYRLWRPAPLAVAVAAFADRSSSVHALGRYHVPTLSSGRNTQLGRASPSDPT